MIINAVVKIDEILTVELFDIWPDLLYSIESMMRLSVVYICNRVQLLLSWKYRAHMRIPDATLSIAELPLLELYCWPILCNLLADKAF